MSGLYVKNISMKPIGFEGPQKTSILPDEIAPLPDGYDDKHPVVKFYLAQGYLVKVDATAEAERKAADAKAEADRLAAAKDEADRKAADAKAEADRLAENAAAAAKEAELDKKIKALAALKLDELKTEAAGLGIEVAENDTKAVLTQKITDKYREE